MDEAKMENQTEQATQESGISKLRIKVNQAIRTTAQQYLDRTHIQLDLSQEENFIRSKPLQSVAVAAGIGFILGGGVTTRLGIVLFGMVGNRVFRVTAFNLARDIVS